MNQKWSIITINFNNNIGLKKTIESVLNQTNRDFEFIIIDGGSTDGSKEYIQEKNEFIDYWVSEPDDGIYHAMNKGIDKSNGKYLYFLNSGDIFFSNDVLKSLSLYNTDADLYAGNVVLHKAEFQTPILWKTKSNYRFSEIAFGHIPHQGFFFKSDLFKIFGYYNVSNKIVSDWEFFLKLIYNNIEIQYIDINFAIHYLDGISQNINFIDLQNFEREAVLKNYISIYQDIRMIQECQKSLYFLKSKLLSSFKRLFAKVMN